MKTTINSVLSVLLFTCWAGCISAQPITGAASDTRDANTDSANTGQMAARVFRDPETGALGGPPAGVEPAGLDVATQNSLNRSSTGLQSRQLPDGTVLLDLQGRFHNMGVVTLDKDGEAHLSCSHSVEQVEKAMVNGADLSVKHGEGAR